MILFKVDLENVETHKNTTYKENADRSLFVFQII